MIYHGKKQVATAGVAVALFAVPQKAAWIKVFPSKSDGSANAGIVRLGGAFVNPATGVLTLPPASIAAGYGMSIPATQTAGQTFNDSQAPNPWDLSQIYLDADTAGDGVAFLWGTV